MQKASHFIIVCIVVGTSLLGCSSSTLKQHDEIEVTFSDPNRLRFSGKGAGAGMMMMSSMGAMGVAIGVAIDEGIGKDIEKMANEAGVNLPDLISQNIKQTLANTGGPFPEWIVVERYGFKTSVGKGDPIVAELRVRYTFADESSLLIHYPEDSQHTPADALLSVQFEQVKTDARRVEQLMRDATSKNVNAMLKVAL